MDQIHLLDGSFFSLHQVQNCFVYSHTDDMFSQVFFQGEEVFKTSSEQTCCTIGVWAAFDPCLNVIVLDTEGLLGTTNHENQRTRLLLKVRRHSHMRIHI